MMLDMDNTGFLIVALLLGLLVGAGAAWLVARASCGRMAQRFDGVSGDRAPIGAFAARKAPNTPYRARRGPAPSRA